MALTKYAYWDFSGEGLTPTTCHSEEAGFNLLKRGTLTFSEDHLVNNGNGKLVTQFGMGQGPFCNDDVMCFRLIFSTTQLQERYIFSHGVDGYFNYLAVKLSPNGKIIHHFTETGTSNTYKTDGTKNDFRIIVDRVNSKITFNLNGIESVVSYPIRKDPSYPNISFGDVNYGDVFRPFYGNMYAAWYADDPSGLNIGPKILFKKESSYYKFNLTSKSMEVIGTVVTEQDFKDYGTSDFSSVEIDNLIFKDFKPMVHMPENSNINFKLNFKPEKVLVRGSGDILLNTKHIKKIKNFYLDITKSGAGEAKIVFSIDSGITWKKYNSVSGLLENVNMDVDSILSSGNTQAEINTIPENIWAEVANAQKIRFAYALNKNAYSDIIKVDKLSMKVDIWGYLREYLNAEVRLRNGYSEIIISELGTYMVNYI